MSRRRVRLAAGGAAALVLVAGGLVLAPAAVADVPDDTSVTAPPPPEPTAEQLERAVQTYAAHDRTFRLDGTISELATETKEGGETTITLATDILFRPDSWEIPANGADRVAELVADIPDGATVQVAGHTDSVDGAVDNQTLSQNRAEAVAAAIAGARPDLVLEVDGFADTQPAVTEDPDDPSTLAANRRVEIVYEG